MITYGTTGCQIPTDYVHGKFQLSSLKACSHLTFAFVSTYVNGDTNRQNGCPLILCVYVITGAVKRFIPSFEILAA